MMSKLSLSKQGFARINLKSPYALPRTQAVSSREPLHFQYPSNLKQRNLSFQELMKDFEFLDMVQEYEEYSRDTEGEVNQ